MFKKLLIANRGEIALRIIRACHELGVRTVAVYSEADRESLHVRFADEDVCIGPAPAKDSYLNVSQIIAAAEITGAEAIHPGYGFLAEDAEFSEICQRSNIVFIGPTPQQIRSMGDKATARRTMKDLGVATVPGSDGIVSDFAEAGRIAADIGFPVMIKASSGGGGKGMRLASDAESFEHLFQAARTEAEAAFGNADVYLEKCIVRPRHVEFQIFGDQRGRVVHLGERDCSIQRRHQKLIEEAPSPALTPELRDEMGKAAVLAGEGIDYHRGRDGRISRRRGWLVLFHRDEHPNPGRAPRHGSDHGARLGEGADPRGGRQSAVIPVGGAEPAGACHRVPYQRRRRFSKLRSGARADRHVPPARGAGCTARHTSL